MTQPQPTTVDSAPPGEPPYASKAGKKSPVMVEQEIGALLHRTRLSRKVTLEAASADLNIRRLYLEALESGDFASIQPHVYLMGFLRSYAQYLGLDAAEICRNYREVMSDPSLLPSSVVMHRPATRSSFQLGGTPNTELMAAKTQGLGSMWVLLGIFVVAMGAWYVYNYQNQLPSPSQDATPNIQASEFIQAPLNS